MANKKICYVLPKFDLDIDTHYFYLYDFINEVSKDLDIVLLIEKSNSDISFFKNVSKVYVQRFSYAPLRIIENFILLKLIRLRGVKDFYIHYSQISAFNASIIARTSGARTFYWNCGMMWLFGKKRFLAMILKMVTHLVTGVEKLKQGYVQNYNISADKVKIMPNWIDLARFRDFDEGIYSKYNLEKGADYVLFVHRLAERKGAHYIADIARQNKNTKFLIAGDGPYRKKLEEDIADLDNVIVLGKVPNKDVPAMMKISKIFFMPSEEEGFPRVLAEAMAAGMACVAFDIGGTKEICADEQKEYIYPVGDTEAMARAIEKFMTDQELFDRISKINLEHVKQFDISIVKDKFVKLITE